MTLEQANHITQDYAKFLEVSHGNLLLLFVTDIPEGLLPYSRDVLENAFDIMLNHYSVKKDAASVYQNAKSTLLFYTNSTKGVNAFLSKEHHKEFYKHFSKSSSEQQNRLLDYVKKNF